VRRKVTGNPLNVIPMRGKPFDPRDWAAHSNEFLVNQLLDAIEHGDPKGDAALLSMEVNRRGLADLAAVDARRRMDARRS
jgi:hypothetical protein